MLYCSERLLLHDAYGDYGSYNDCYPDDTDDELIEKAAKNWMSYSKCIHQKIKRMNQQSIMVMPSGTLF